MSGSFVGHSRVSIIIFNNYTLTIKEEEEPVMNLSQINRQNYEAEVTKEKKKKMSLGSGK